MVDYWRLNTNVYVKGAGLSDPILYYYADASKTVTVELYDINGNGVLTSSAGLALSYSFSDKGVADISLGDWLGANDDKLNEGIYILLIDNGSDKFVVPLFVAIGASTKPSEDEEYIERIAVFDKLTGAFIELPPTTATLPMGDRWQVWMYYHSKKYHVGRLKVFETYPNLTTIVDTKWGKTVIAKMVIDFDSLQKLAGWLARWSFVRNPHKDVVEAIAKLLNTEPEKTVNVLKLYGFVPFMFAKPMDFDVIVDTENNVYRIEYRVLIQLGWGWDTIVRAGMVALGVGAIVGGIAAGIAVATGTFGLGAAVGVGIAAAGVTFGLEILKGAFDQPQSAGIDGSSAPSIPEMKGDIVKTVEEGEKKIDEASNTALQHLDELYQNNEITEHAYNILKQDILNLQTTAKLALQDVKEVAVDSLDKAYQRGKEEMKRWAIIGTAAGFGGGVVLASFLKR